MGKLGLVLAATVAGVAGCSLIVSMDGFSGGPSAPGDEGGVDGSIAEAGAEGAAPAEGGTPGTDAGFDAGPPACDHTGAFGSITAMTGLNSAFVDGDARLDDARLSAVLVNDSTGKLQMYYSARPSLGAEWAAPKPIGGIASAADDYGPWISPDNLRIYFASRRGGSLGGANLFFAQRGSAKASFNAPEALGNVNSAADDTTPWVMPDESAIYFASNRGDALSIWVATGGPGGFGAPVQLAGIHVTGVSDNNPVVTADGLVLYFTSNRAPTGIFRATRNATTEDFGGVTLVTELAGTAHQFPTWVSGDDCSIVFVSDKNGGNEDIYYAERPPP